MAKRTMSETEASAHFGELLEAVSGGDEIVIERDGEAIGALIPPERYLAIQRSRERLWAFIDGVHERNEDLTEAEVEALVSEEVAAARAEMRAGAAACA